MKVNIYVGYRLDANSPLEYNKVDLFQDEKIEITQKLTDIEKLSNIFSDYTNSFTIPATPNNNRIFKHYYEIDIDNTFNANIRVPGIIEVDTIPFKYGEFQLESVDIKSNKPENYKISFFSKVVQLSELFGNDTLDTLLLSQYDYSYTGPNMVKTINDPTFLNGDVITPLIAYSDRDWEYGTNNTLDISNNTYPILDNELKSALRVMRIIEAIETKYDIVFSREFFGTAMFNKLFLWMNGKIDKASGNILVDIINSITTSGPTNNFYNCSVDATNDIFTINDTAFNYNGTRVFSLLVNFNTLRDLTTNVIFTDRYFNIKIVDADTNLDFYNGTLKTNSIGGITFNIPIDQASTSTTRRFKFFISSSSSFTYSSMNILLKYVNGGSTYFANSENNNGNYLNIFRASTRIPNLKVLDFITGLMKMFKLIIRPLSSNNFYLDTLDNYYSNGNFININNYVDIKSVTLTRPDIYSTINFSYEKTNNVLGKNFRESKDPINDLIGYGDLADKYEISTKNSLAVKLPFENMLFERMTITNGVDITTTNICIGQSVKLNDDRTTVSKNDSKPILFFNNGQQSISTTPVKFKFSNNTVQTINSYYLCTNTDNKNINDVTTSLNWGAEIDPWHLQEVQFSLFNNYWSNWLSTIYSTKQRKIKVKANLPSRYVTELSLNDRLIFGNNKYKISDFRIDLTTGETDFNLFNDV